MGRDLVLVRLGGVIYGQGLSDGRWVRTSARVVVTQAGDDFARRVPHLIRRGAGAKGAVFGHFGDTTTRIVEVGRHGIIGRCDQVDER